MKPYYSNSLIFSSAKKLNLSYRHSNLKCFIDTCISIFKESHLCLFLHNYLRKEPAGDKSVIYRVLAAIFSAVDKIAGKLVVFSHWSLIVNTIRNIIGHLKTNNTARNGSLAASFLLAFIAGYTICCSLITTWTALRLVFVLLMLILAIFTYKTLAQWSYWVKNSMCYRVIKTIFE